MQFPDLGFGVDKRIKRRYAAFSKSSLFGNKVSIQSISQNRAAQIANYRLLQNPKLSEGLLIEEIKSRCSKAVTGKIPYRSLIGIVQDGLLKNFIEY
jgi:hypothetical protein